MTPIPESLRRPGAIVGKRKGSLKALFNKAGELLALQEHIRDIVPGPVYVASLTDGELHLTTPSAAFATRIRYNQRKLIRTLTLRYHLDVKSILVAVRPDPQPARAVPPEAKPMSPAAGEQLASSAQYIEDPGLRKALISLSKRVRSPQAE